MKVRFSLAGFLVCLTLSLSGSALCQEKSTTVPSKVIAVVNNSRSITLEELDKMIAPQLRPLQEQIFFLRKNALDNLILSIVIEEAAKQKGLSVPEFREKLTPAKESIEISEIEAVFKEYSQTFNGLSVDEAKQMVRLDLEAKARLKAYRQAISSLRGKSEVKIFLEPPPSPIVEINYDGPTKGSKDAPVKIVVFSDFQCPFCKKAVAPLEQIAQQYSGKVSLTFKHFPLPMHEMAMPSAKASTCASEQGKFWDFHDKVFSASSLSDDVFNKIANEIGLDIGKYNECIKSSRPFNQIKKDIEEGQKIQINSTPTIIINGKLFRGIMSVEELKNIVEKESVKKPTER